MNGREPYKIVLVVWLDACGGSKDGWHSMRSILRQKPYEARSVGYLVREEEDYIVVCPHLVGIGERDIDGDGELAIPRSWIKKVVTLKK
jgi:hypothetical protein